MFPRPRDSPRPARGPPRRYTHGIGVNGGGGGGQRSGRFSLRALRKVTGLRRRRRRRFPHYLPCCRSHLVGTPTAVAKRRYRKQLPSPGEFLALTNNTLFVIMIYREFNLRSRPLSYVITTLLSDPRRPRRGERRRTAALCPFL